MNPARRFLTPTVDSPWAGSGQLDRLILPGEPSAPKLARPARTRRPRMPTEELTVELGDGGDRITLTVRGDLDFLTVGRLRTALADVSASAPTTVVTVNLADAKRFGALPVGLFAHAARRLQRNGSRLLVCGVTPFQERLMRICGLRQVVVRSS